MTFLKKVEFFSQREAEARVGHTDEAIISVAAPSIPDVDLKGKWGAILRLRFDDVEPGWAAPEHVLFDLSQAGAVWVFVQQLPCSVQALCIHCRSGISRSGALAKAISEHCDLTFDGEERECNAHVLQLMRISRRREQVMRHEEMHKGYKIVAQFWKGTFKGRAWGDGVELVAEGESISDVVEQLKRKIPKGGAKVQFKPPDLTHYVGTVNSVGRVFHRSKCGWMNNVKSSDEVAFESREAALVAGYSPCHSCRP